MICPCYYLIFIAVIILAFILYNQKSIHIKENWTTYQSGPYGTIKTGSTPLRTYTRMLYREPYMYPYKYFTNYPMRAMTFGPPN